MNEFPKVLIVTPSFNQAQFLEKTILSVLNQDYPNLEYIIMDGGSTDGSVNVIRKYEDRLAYWVSEPDNGQADAINKGWRMSHGEILAYLNSDDTYEPGAVRTAVETFLQHPEVYLVYGDMNFVDAQGNVLEQFHAPDFDLRTFIGDSCYIRQPTTLFKRAALQEVGMLDTRLHYALDYDLFIRICARFPVRRIPRVVANFRRHPASKTMSGSATQGDHTFWPEERALLERVARNPQFPVEVRALAWRRIGLHYYERRDMALARRMFIRGILAYKPFLTDWGVMYLFIKSLLGGRVVETASQIRRRLAKNLE